MRRFGSHTLRHSGSFDERKNAEVTQERRALTEESGKTVSQPRYKDGKQILFFLGAFAACRVIVRRLRHRCFLYRRRF